MINLIVPALWLLSSYNPGILSYFSVCTVDIFVINFLMIIFLILQEEMLHLQICSFSFSSGFTLGQKHWGRVEMWGQKILKMRLGTRIIVSNLFIVIKIGINNVQVESCKWQNVSSSPLIIRKVSIQFGSIVFEQDLYKFVCGTFRWESLAPRVCAFVCG